jgi:hypothetical protein
VRMRLGGSTNVSIKNIWRGNQEIAASLRSHGEKLPWLTILRRMTQRVPQFIKALK